MDRGTAAAPLHSINSFNGQLLQHHSHLQHGASNRQDIASDIRDQEQQELAQLSLDLPITYMPFKFENRRVRIDWRLLHGVDIDKLVRDTDLDTLEELVTCVTWGDIAAEDTRQLSEGNFIKVFRLAQLLLEYLLYVQENLKYTNSVLDKSRSTAVFHAQGLNTRCRDLYNQLKHCKRELKRAHKTVKTFELMAAAVGGAAAAAQAASAAAAVAPAKPEAAWSATPAPPAQQPLQQTQAPAQQQQTQQQSSVMSAGELLLQSQLSELTERLTLAVCEAERLRSERQELQYQIRHLHDTLAAKLGNSALARDRSNSGGSRTSHNNAAIEAATAAAVAASQQQQQQLFMAELQCAQAQINELQAENKELRQQLKQHSDDTTLAESSLATLKAQLEEQGQELVRLQGELRQREASIKVFQTSNAALEQQVDNLQRQLALPEATTPSFVAKQRQQLAAAASAHAGLQAENTKLRQELLELRLALESNAGSRSVAPGAAAAVAALKADGAPNTGGEGDALAEAERILAGHSGEGHAVALVRCSTTDWKVQEIERLQLESKQLQAKVSSLQEALYEAECTNARLEKRLAAAEAAGYVASAPSSPNKAAAAAAAAPAAPEVGAADDAPGSAYAGWASVGSSGPAAEPTAADLVTATPQQPSPQHSDTCFEQQQQQHAGAGAADAIGSNSTVVEPAAAAAISKATSQAIVSSGDGLHEGDGERIAAYRPSQDDAAGGSASHVRSPAQAAPAVSSAALAHPVPVAAVSTQQQHQPQAAPDLASRNGGSAAAPVVRGSIDQAAAQQLRSLVAALQSELTPEQLAEEYAEVCCDWDKPFDLTQEEKAQFRSKVPLEVDGLQDVLCSSQHSAEDVTAAKPRILSAINRILDAQVASFGIHPGRSGLSNLELLAAMKMLTERREAFEAGLSPEQRQEVEVTRLGLLLHPYHALQSHMAGLTEGTDGKKHLPPLPPALASAVRPPAVPSLPRPPPPIRLQPQGPSPLGSPAGFGGPAGALASSGPAAAQVMLHPASNRATPSPSASARYGAAHDTDSEDGHSPVRRQELYSAFTYHAGSSGGGAVHLRPPSPLGSEAAQEAIAKAANSGSFSPMSAALQAKQQLLRRSHESGSGKAGSVGSVSPGTRSPLGHSGGGAAGAPQQQSKPAPAAAITPAMAPGAKPVAAALAEPDKKQENAARTAAATKQFLTTLEDSDEF